MKDKSTQAVLSRLKRAEGQIRGIQKMVSEKRYCVDLLTQTSAVVSALHRVEDIILQSHLNYCVAAAMSGSNRDDKQEKVDELLMVVSKFRKQG